MSLLAGLNYTKTGVNTPLTVVDVLNVKTTSTNNGNNSTGLVIDTGAGSTIAMTIANGTGGMTSFSPFVSPQGRWSLQPNSAAGATGQSSAYVVNDSVSSANLATGTTADFTWECYVMRNVSATSSVVMSHSTGAAVFAVNAGTSFTMFGTTITSSVAATAFKPNQWNHVAIVRASGNLMLYINGYPIGTPVANSTSYLFYGTAATIGNLGSGENTGAEWVGNISNLRIVIGTAVYTGLFTPSRSPLTAITNTKLLCLSGPSVLDYSGVGNSLLLKGPSAVPNARVVVLNPFSADTSYTPGTIGGYSSPLGNATCVAASSVTPPGTQDFTIDGWFYLTAAPSAGACMFGMWNTGTLSTSTFAVTAGGGGGGANNSLRIVMIDAGTTRDTVFTAQGALLYNSWMHIAISRSGTSYHLYVNGKRLSTVTPSASVYNLNQTTNGLSLMSFADNAGLKMTGYASNVRLIVGSALYTAATYTVPTAPLTTTGTTATINAKSPNIFDNVGQSGVVTFGNAKVSTAQSAYGAASMQFAGAGDYLFVPQPQNAFQFGLGDFTVEAYVRFNAANSAQTFIDARLNASNVNSWWIQRNASNKFEWGFGGSTVVLTSTGTYAATNTWYHVTYCRSNGVGRLFVNGVLDSSLDDSARAYSTPYDRGFIGATYANSNNVNGFVQGVRVSKFARYIDNFTPPTNY